MGNDATYSRRRALVGATSAGLLGVLWPRSVIAESNSNAPADHDIAPELAGRSIVLGIILSIERPLIRVRSLAETLPREFTIRVDQAAVPSFFDEPLTLPGTECVATGTWGDDAFVTNSIGVPQHLRHTTINEVADGRLVTDIGVMRYAFPTADGSPSQTIVESGPNAEGVPPERLAMGDRIVARTCVTSISPLSLVSIGRQR